MEYPISNIEAILTACQPNEPLKPDDSRYYTGLAKLRHGAGLKPLQQALRNAEARPPHIHRCLCGHRGSGKSTELYSFEEWAMRRGFLPVRVEPDKRLGLIALEATDLFLLAALAPEEALNDHNLPIPHKAIAQIGRWFAEVVREDKNGIHSEIGAVSF